ncbi:unnamed protein product [Durusdinium trenchii]|uniref:Uncharacterized protein n=2 Tax=Durusdinium trenchii TaxID=1381693 RepID=A0ABP0HX21_9DINO
MARRAERLMLGTLWVPRSITAIRVVCRDNPVVVDWMHRFVPMLRYGSPALEFHFHRLQIQAKETDAKACCSQRPASTVQRGSSPIPTASFGATVLCLDELGPGHPPNVPNSTGADRAPRSEARGEDEEVKEEEEGAPAANKASEQAEGAGAAPDAGPADVVSDDLERMELEFADGTKHLLNMELYISSHQVMQRILDVDAEKTLSIV